jgi:hypothetical protein
MTSFDNVTWLDNANLSQMLDVLEDIQLLPKEMHDRLVDLVEKIRQIERDTPYRLQRREEDKRCYFKSFRANIEPDQVDDPPGPICTNPPFKPFKGKPGK